MRRILKAAKCNVAECLPSDHTESVATGQHMAIISGDTFKRQQVIARLEQVGLETEREPVSGIRRQLALSPDAPAVGRRNGGPVRLKSGIGLQFEEQNNQFRRRHQLNSIYRLRQVWFGASRDAQSEDRRGAD